MAVSSFWLDDVRCTIIGTTIGNCFAKVSHLSIPYQSRGHFGMGNSLVFINHFQCNLKVCAVLFIGDVVIFHIFLRWWYNQTIIFVHLSLVNLMGTYQAIAWPHLSSWVRPILFILLTFQVSITREWLLLMKVYTHTTKFILQRHQIIITLRFFIFSRLWSHHNSAISNTCLPTWFCTQTVVFTLLLSIDSIKELIIARPSTISNITCHYYEYHLSN